jgi:hypothetical protein
LQNSCHTFLNGRHAEIRLFLFAAECFNTESMQKGYPNYRSDFIRYVKG